MQTLADGHFAPITYSWGFLEAPVQAVRDCLISWRRELKQEMCLRDAEGDLYQALSLLDPLSAPWTKELLLCTKSPWTAYFNNQSTGGDPFPPVGYLSQLLGCRGLIVQSFPDGSCSFSLTGAEQTDFLNVERSVRALRDGGAGWEFATVGPPLPFEDTARYTRKLIKDRLDDELLQRYFAEFGIHLFDNGFYGGKYVFLSQDIWKSKAMWLLRGIKPRQIALDDYRPHRHLLHDDLHPYHARDGRE